MASGPSSAGPGSSGGGGFSGSFLGKQFSFASTGSKTSSTDVISTQPSRPVEESAIQPQAAASVSVSNNKNTDNSAVGYQPVTNFEPQERVNPFDKEPNKAASASGSVASITTSSSSSISSSSISSRINRNGNSIKSPPPPSGPPPPPPNVASNANSSSGYRNSFSSSLSKDKTSYGNYGSSTSVETITRMDTNTTNTGATATGAGEASGITAITSLSSSGLTGPTGQTGAGIESALDAITTSATTDWRSAIGMRSASVYSAPAAVTTTAALPGDTSGYDSNSIASQGGYNNPSDLPSYTRPSYSRSESNASKQSDLDIIFGDGQISGSGSAHGNGKYTRAAGSLSDADMIFGGPPSNYKSDRFGAAKSMSMCATSGSASGSGSTSGSYKIYEGIQNAAFSDFSDTGSVSSIGSATKRWSAANRDDDDEMDLK